MSHSTLFNKKFLFETDFDQTAVEKTYDQQDIDIACRQSYIEGVDAGRLQTLKEIDAECRTILTHIAGALQNIRAIEQQSFMNAGIIAEKITKAMFPTFFEKGAFLEVQTVLSNVLEKLNSTNALTLYCAQEMEPKLKQFIDTLQTDTLINIHAQKDMAISDIKIDWKTGFAERDQGLLQETIDNLLENYTTEIQTKTHEGEQ